MAIARLNSLPSHLFKAGVNFRIQDELEEKQMAIARPNSLSFFRKIME